MRRVEDLKLAPNERSSLFEAAEALKADFPVTRVLLFGSKVRGAGEPDSDYIPTVTFDVSEVSARVHQAREFIDLFRCLIKAG